YFQLGRDAIQFKKLSPDGNKVTFTGNDADFSLNGSFRSVEKENSQVTDEIVSTQIGFKAPILAGKVINAPESVESLISTGQLRGKYVLLDFWSTYCGPCFLEFPYLKEAYTVFSRDQFEIIGVLDERNSSLTDALIKKHDLTWPNIKANAEDTEMSGYRIS